MAQSRKALGYFVIASGMLQLAFYLISKAMENDLETRGLILPVVAAAAFTALGISIIRKAR